MLRLACALGVVQQQKASPVLSVWTYIYSQHRCIDKHIQGKEELAVVTKKYFQMASYIFCPKYHHGGIRPMCSNGNLKFND